MTRVRIGAGPARHKLKLSSAGNEGLDLQKNVWGFVAQGGFMVWEGKSIFAEVTAQYRGMGSLALPAVELGSPSSFGPDAATTATILATDIPYRNWSVGVSFGVQLR